MESTQQKVIIPRTNKKLEHVFSKGPFLHQLFNEQEKEKKPNQKSSYRFSSEHQRNSPHSPRRQILSINISVSSEVLEFRGGGEGGAAAAVCNACGVPCCPEGQSREMMSGAPPPLLVMTPASARPEELTCVLLSWWLVEVMMLPGVLLVKVEVRLSKNIGGQYCLKQTTKSEETNCTREMYALKIHLPHTTSTKRVPSGTMARTVVLQIGDQTGMAAMNLLPHPPLFVLQNGLGWKNPKAHLIPSPAMGRDTFDYPRLLQALSNLDNSRDGAATAALCSLCLGLKYTLGIFKLVLSTYLL